MTPATSTVLWRLVRPGGDRAHAVLLPGGPPFTLGFFMGEDMDRVENYDTLDLALFRGDEVRRSLADQGWLEDDQGR